MYINAYIIFTLAQKHGGIHTQRRSETNEHARNRLIFLCGGDKELYDLATPMLEVMGKKHMFLGA